MLIWAGLTGNGGGDANQQSHKRWILTTAAHCEAIQAKDTGNESNGSNAQVDPSPFVPLWKETSRREPAFPFLRKFDHVNFDFHDVVNACLLL